MSWSNGASTVIIRSALPDSFRTDDRQRDFLPIPVLWERVGKGFCRIGQKLNLPGIKSPALPSPAYREREEFYFEHQLA